MGASYSPAVVLVVVLMAALVFSASAAEKTDESLLTMTTSDHRIERCDTSRPFCNECTICDRSANPRCVCGDLTHFGCHNLCKNCVKSSLQFFPPLFHCKDGQFYYCKNTCGAGV